MLNVAKKCPAICPADEFGQYLLVRSLVALVFCGICVSAQMACGSPVATVFPDSKSLAQSIDAIVTNRMAQGHVPGAVVTLVQDGKVVFNKGYGLADLENQKAVDSDKTLFRIASVSKVFTATAVMRLAQKGTIHPDDDIRPHLRFAEFPFDETVAGPITWTDLLTHTGGIRERFVPDLTVTTNAAKIIPLGEYLRQCLPLRWQRTREILLYSDHGIALAGYLMEIVSKKPFAKVISDTVFQPLKMNNTGYAPPKKKGTAVAVAYQFKNARYEPMDYAFSNIDPALGAVTTGSDMARFMIAHLNARSKFLNERSRKYMHQVQFTDEPRLKCGVTSGLFESANGSQKYLFSLGHALGFVSMLYLVPEEGIGLFVSQNRTGDLVLTLQDLQRFTTDAQMSPLQKTTNSMKLVSGAKDVAGKYALSRTLSSGDGERDYVQIECLSDSGEIQLVDWRKPDSPTRWSEIEPLLFRATTSDDLIAFRRSPDGSISYMFGLFPPFGVFKRVATTEPGSSAVSK